MAVSTSRNIPLFVADPAARAMDAVARLLRTKTAPPLNYWLITSMARDRVYISAARRDLGYEPRIDLESGMREIADEKTRT